MAKRKINTQLTWRFDRIPVDQQMQVINWFHLSDWSRLKIHFKKWRVMPSGICTDCGVQTLISEWTFDGIKYGYIVPSNT